jgi:tetratricopeptide (TPR) repeat protein
MSRTDGFIRAAAVAALVLAGAAARVPAADDTPLRDKALQLNSVTGQDAITGKIQDLLTDKSGLKLLIAEAAGMAKEKEQPFNYTGAFILARAAHATKDFDNSLVFYKVCVDQAVKLKSGQKLVQVYDGLISLFMETKKFDEAVKACQQFLEIRGDEKMEQIKPFVIEQMILALAQQKKYDDALKLTDKLVELDEGGWYFLKLKGTVLRDQGKLEEALKAFEDALEKLPQSKLKDAEKDRYANLMKYMTSGIYTDLNQIDKAAEVLQELLKKNPTSATFHNDLGYIWADNDKNLDESEKLIRKALEIEREARKKLKDEGVLDAEDDKDNAAYVDSLAWVLYKKKNFAEAKKYLLEAIKSDEGKHVEIFDHLADVHMALGEKKEAVEVWKKALQLENVSKRDEARKEEIKKKLTKEEGEKP